VVLDWPAFAKLTTADAGCTTRLAVVEVRLPPLPERLDHVLTLVEAMLQESRATPLETSRLMSAAFLDQLRDSRARAEATDDLASGGWLAAAGNRQSRPGPARARSRRRDMLLRDNIADSRETSWRRTRAGPHRTSWAVSSSSP
jgi:hypothetical protein